ncbi:MAG: Crp/Fnr family transcriptional regulator [Gudongella sp.]|nr:Crp/Fnr family transcriptional regulator [Gudongella sp.]
MNCNCNDRGQNCIEMVPIFSNLTYDEMVEIAMITTETAIEKGESIYNSGDILESLYVIHKGSVKIIRYSDTGKEQVLRVVGSGQFIGELAIFSSEPASDTAIALEKTIMCRIDGRDIKDLMARHPSIAFKILDEMSQRLKKAETLVEGISLHSVERRIAGKILEMDDGKGEIRLEMSKGDWASHLGMSQETLSRKLTSFQDQGLIRLKGQRGIIITDREGLERIE